MMRHFYNSTCFSVIARDHHDPTVVHSQCSVDDKSYMSRVCLKDRQSSMNVFLYSYGAWNVYGEKQKRKHAHSRHRHAAPYHMKSKQIGGRSEGLCKNIKRAVPSQWLLHLQWQEQNTGVIRIRSCRIRRGAFTCAGSFR